MRLWSLHPDYLDRVGLLAVWREGLLARAVLRDMTRGYKNHPQLIRFKEHPEPLRAIDHYLYEILIQSQSRGYHFDATKIEAVRVQQLITLTSGQLEFETRQLLAKLKKRSPKDYQQFVELHIIDPHPLFQVFPGDIEDWEKKISHGE